MLLICVPDILVTHDLYPREGDHGNNENTHIFIFKGHLIEGHSQVLQYDKGQVIGMPKKTFHKKCDCRGHVCKIVEEFYVDYIKIFKDLLVYFY